LVNLLVCNLLPYCSASAAKSSRQKAGISSTTEDVRVDYDTLHLMQQIGAVSQRSEE
jgi:hypothetical protein